MQVVISVFHGGVKRVDAAPCHFLKILEGHLNEMIENTVEMFNIKSGNWKKTSQYLCIKSLC